MALTQDPLISKLGTVSPYVPSAQTSPSASSVINSPAFSSGISPGGTQSTTPQQGGAGNIFGAIGNVLGSLTGSNSTYSDIPKVAPTSTGGITFDPSLASGFNNQSTIKPATTGILTGQNSGGLEQYITAQHTTPGGASAVSNNGQISQYNPNASFNANVGSIDSNALQSNTGLNDIQQRQNQYQEYVNALAQAQGYSPQYIQALQAQQQAAAQGGALQVNSAALNSNLYTGNNLPGDTLNYAQGATAKAQAQNTLAQSQNSLQQLSASQQMQVQALIRSGNIAAAQSLVQASQPVGVSPGTSLVSPLNGQQTFSGIGGLVGVNALNQANSLQQSHPDANIPSYDPSTMTPQQYQQLAMKAVAASPSFQSQTPEGQANISSLVSQQAYLDTTNRSYQTATSNLGTLQNFMQSNSINDSNIPIINQINNKVKAGTLAPGVIAAFESSIQGLRAEYAQVLSRGGVVTDTERNAANTLIPDDLNPSQLATVTKQLSLEGQNAIREAQSSVDTIKNRLGGQTQASGTGSNSNGWY